MSDVTYRAKFRCLETDESFEFNFTLSSPYEAAKYIRDALYEQTAATNLAWVADALDEIPPTWRARLAAWWRNR